MGNETEKHKLLKESAKLFLKDLGFKKEEIFTEYKVDSTNIREYFLVDVVGIKFNNKIGIECGMCSGYSPHFWKFELLKETNFFDKIYYFPYITTRIKKVEKND